MDWHIIYFHYKKHIANISKTKETVPPAPVTEVVVVDTSSGAAAEISDLSDGTTITRKKGGKPAGFLSGALVTEHLIN
jgi:hypothetical protein